MMVISVSFVCSLKYNYIVHYPDLLWRIIDSSYGLFAAINAVDSNVAVSQYPNFLHFPV